MSLLTAAARGLVATSGSMEPAFFRGDLLFLTNYASDPIRVGEVCVFKVRDRDIPIVHRIHAVHEECGARGVEKEGSTLCRGLAPTRGARPPAGRRARSSF